MAALLDRFMQVYGNGTKQIGRTFCIPASLCNAVRLCGVTSCTQELLRDAWYAEQGKAIEPNIDDQMGDAHLGMFETMERRIEGMNQIDNALLQLSSDDDPIVLRKADLALEFVEHHIKSEHPVIASTWNRIQKDDRIEIHGYHMWLILDFDRNANAVVFHDSLLDKVCEATITKTRSVRLGGKEVQLDFGLRGCITHTDYSCLAIWRKSA